MKKYSIVIIAISAIVINLGLFYYWQKQKLRNLKDVNLELESLDQALDKSFLYSGYLFLDKQSIYTNELDSSVAFKSIFFSSIPKLVLRLNSTFCDDCLKQELPNLISLSRVIGEENIILLCSFKNMPGLSKFKKIKEIPFKLFNSTNDKIFTESIDQYIDFPYYFITDSSGMATSFFVTSTSSRTSEIYYSAIKKIFLNQSKKTIGFKNELP
jgi:hypothetical protein